MMNVKLLLKQQLLILILMMIIIMIIIIMTIIITIVIITVIVIIIMIMMIIKNFPLISVGNIADQSLVDVSNKNFYMKYIFQLTDSKHFP